MGIAEATKELTENIARSHRDRTAALAAIKEEIAAWRQRTQSMIQDFRIWQIEGGTERRKELTQNRRDREREVKGLLKEFANWCQETNKQMKNDRSLTHAERSASVNATRAEARALVEECHDSRHHMGIQLRNELLKSREMVATGFAKIRAEFRQTQTELRADLKEAANAWRWIGTFAPTGKSASNKIASVARGRTMPEEAPNLRDQLLSAVTQHKDGISLSEMAKSIGVMAITLSKLAKELVANGQIRREGKLYFPAAT